MCAIRRVLAFALFVAYFVRSRAITKPGNTRRTPHNLVTALLSTYGEDTAIPGGLGSRSFVFVVFPRVPAA
jgi:hypothetical protein